MSGLLLDGISVMTHLDVAHVAAPRARRAVLNALPENALVETTLECDRCGRVHVIALPEDMSMATLLAVMSCPRCRALGSLALLRGEVA